jgi:hypothetical protein
MRMDQGYQARRSPTYFGIVRPELLEEDIFLDEDLLAVESRRTEKKPLFGFLSAEPRRNRSESSTSAEDPTTLSRANKFGGR